MPTKLASCSAATPRWWANSWAMVTGRNTAGQSTFRVLSPSGGKMYPVKFAALITSEYTAGLARRSGPARRGYSWVTLSYSPWVLCRMSRFSTAKRPAASRGTVGAVSFTLWANQAAVSASCRAVTG